MKRFLLLAATVSFAVAGCGPVSAPSDTSGVSKPTDKAKEGVVKESVAKAVDKGEKALDKANDVLAGELQKVKAAFDADVAAIEAKISDLDKQKSSSGPDGKPLGAIALKELSDKYTTAVGLLGQLKDKLKGLDLSQLKDGAALGKLKDEVQPLVAKLKDLLGVK